MLHGLPGPSPRGRTLLLFTESYPYPTGREDTFVGPQLPYLQAVFERVILVPSQTIGERAALPDGIEVDESLAARLGDGTNRGALVLRAVGSRVTWDEIARQPGITRSRSAVQLLLRTVGRAAAIEAWLLGALGRGGIRAVDCVAYAFWCDHTALGLVLAKSAHPQLSIAARVNGHDLYLDRHVPPYLPCQETTLHGLDLVFAASRHATDYAIARFDWLRHRIRTSYLGVVDPGFVTAASPPTRLTIVSCSSVTPVKRVDLIAQAVGLVAAAAPDAQVEWHHFGDGSLRPINEIAASFPPNANARLHGHTSIEEIIGFYRLHPVDVFANASSSEGGPPVAIMEAISCGIPVVATEVGGNPEIVSDVNGLLVRGDASPHQIANAIRVVARPASAGLRSGARATWAEHFDAAINLSSIARQLADLRAATKDAAG